ncbi:hypothetical protein M3Y98_00663000 [Aphelenchoides besseyi]|nr:hypothetical protein M3Y98_00663000 [Aphelenchoides besseyi]
MSEIKMSLETQSSRILLGICIRVLRSRSGFFDVMALRKQSFNSSGDTVFMAIKIYNRDGNTNIKQLTIFTVFPLNRLYRFT